MIKRQLFILILLISSIFAQVEFDYSGYLINMPTYSFKNYGISSTSFSVNENLKVFSNLTRIRFRPVLYLWDGARINVEYESNIILRDNNLSLFDQNPDYLPFNQITDLNWNIVNKENISVNHFIDRFYFKQSFEFGNIIVGRQRISWGTGRVWNPTDLFNPINPINFRKLEKDGADAVTSKIIFGDFTDLQLVFNPDELIKKSNYAFRFRTNFNEFDIAAVGGVIKNRTICGFDFAGNFFDAGIRGEFLHSINKTGSNNSFTKFIFGIDYQFTSKLYALIEYYYNGEGENNKDFYNLFVLMKGEIINLGKNYLAISTSYEYSPLLKLSLMTNTNLNDNSGFISVTGNYSLDDDYYLTAGIQVSYGSNFSEYFYYPHSIYLRGEFYF